MKKLTALLLVVIMMLSLLTACGNNQSGTTEDTTVSQEETKPAQTDDDTTDSEKESNDNTQSSDTTDSEPAPEEEPAKAATFPYALKAEKIGDIPISYFTSYENGIRYSTRTEDGKTMYGTASLDGSNHTDAIYTVLSNCGRFFIFSVTETEITTIKDLNRYGVVDCEGNIIVPAEYAAIQTLGTRYIKVCEITEETDNEDEALIYDSDEWLSFGPDDDDPLYKGNWYVYDVTTGKKLEGIGGSLPKRVNSYGDFIDYYTDDDENLIVDENGKSLPEGANLFSNGDGSYEIKDGGKGAIYDTNGELRFEYDLSEYSVSHMNGDYYFAKAYTDSESVSFILNKNGKVISAEFSSSPTVIIHGLLYLYNDSNTYDIYTFDGELVLENVDDIWEDEIFNGCCVAIDTNNVCHYINADGTITDTITLEENVTEFNSINMGVYLNDDVNYDDKYYCLADKNYDLIHSEESTPWCVSVENSGGSNDLVCITTGETLVSGYENYKYQQNPDGNSYYIYAENENNGYDVYLITAAE